MVASVQAAAAERSPQESSRLLRLAPAQGVSCFIAGLFGTANGTTAYNENIGAMQITGVGSRIVVQTGAVIILVVAIIGARCSARLAVTILDFGAHPTAPAPPMHSLLAKHGNLLLSNSATLGCTNGAFYHLALTHWLHHTDGGK